MTFFFEISAIIAVKYERRYGQRLYHIIEICSDGHGDIFAFSLLVFWLISTYVGGLLLNVFWDSGKDSIQDGIRDFLVGLTHLKDFLKN